MHNTSTRFLSYMQRVLAWSGFASAKAPIVATDGSSAPSYGEPDVVETDAGTEIRVYGEILDHMTCELWGLPGSVAISEVGFVRALDKAKATGKPMTMRLNSYGGVVDVGITIAGHIRENALPVTVDGIAASIASVMMAASPKVTMRLGATVMVHNPMTVAMGNSREFRAMAEALDTTCEAMLDIYTAKTRKHYSRADWVAALDGKPGADGSWWTGQQAVAAGLADAYEGGQPEARAALALLGDRRNVAALHGVALPKNLDTEAIEAAEPETPGKAGPAGDTVTSKPGVRVGNRPGAYRYKS